jgi:hypothetical protein
MVVLLGALTLGACELDVTNPNAATEEDVLTTSAGLRALAIGLQGRYGNALEESVFIPGLISNELGNTAATQSTTREFQNFPVTTDNAAIEPTNPEMLDLWVKNYAVVKSANDILDNIDNVAFAAGTRSGMTALARLHKAMAFGNLIEAFELIPIENVPQPAFADRATVLAEILSLLESARDDIAANAPSDDFNDEIRGPGLDLLNTIRAMQARYSLAAGNYQDAVTFAAEVPGTATSVVTFTTIDRNPLRDVYHGNILFGAIASYRTNAETGDTRVAANTMATPLSNAVGGASLFETNVYLTPDASIPLFTQDELSLIRAEAYARSTPPDLANARNELNDVRARAGLPDRTAGELPDQQSVLDEIFRQRTYSLFSRGLHWADQRRFGRFTEMKQRFLPYPFAECATNPNAPRTSAFGVECGD